MPSPTATLDFVYNGQSSGDLGDRLLAARMDPGALRPFFDDKNIPCVELTNWKTQKKKTFVTNAPTTISKEQWEYFDETLVRIARPELKVYGDLVKAGLVFNVPNGMGTTVIQHQKVTDAGEAMLSMDPVAKTNRDRQTYDLVNLPLPIVHSDFSFTLREIEAARTQRIPLDTGMLEQATRKCVELTEKLFIGTLASYTYGGGTVYGMANFPQRVTQALTLPTASGWTPEVLVNELLAMIQGLQDVYFNGPYMVWYSPAWTQYFGADYSAVYNGDTVMSRLGKIPDLIGWRKADYLTPGFQILAVQMNSAVIQAVRGMKLQSIQWDLHGGLEKCFKVMGLMVPRVRANANGATGIGHAAAA